MRSIACLTLIVACAPPQPTRVIVVQPVPPPIRVAAPSKPVHRGPIVIEPVPYTSGTFTISSEPPYAHGTVRTIRKLRDAGAIDDFVFESPRRVVVATGKRWHLMDPVDDREIAEIGKPKGRLSETEIVVEHKGDLDAVVDLRDGMTIAPVPQLPIAAPLESMYVLHARESGSGWYQLDAAERGADVFLMATAGGRTFMGLWNDRAPQPTLVHEIERPPGWHAHRRADGLDLEVPVGKTCKGLRLYRTREPVCVDPPFDGRRIAITGSWEASIEGRRLVAHDLASGRDEQVELPCAHPEIAESSRKLPRVAVDCWPSDGDPYFSVVTWTPGRAFVFREVTGDRLVHVSEDLGRLLAIVPNDPQFGDVAERWLDLETGTILHGPKVDVQIVETVAPFVAFAPGANSKRTRVVVIDPAHASMRTAAELECAGKLMIDDERAHYTAFSCRLEDRPGLYDFARVWTKIVDTRNAKIYDLAGYADAIFADGIAVVQNRPRIAAETRGPRAALTVVALE